MMAPGKSPKHGQYKARQNVRQFSAQQSNSPQQSRGQQVLQPNTNTQQQDSAPSYQQVPGQRGDLNQTTNQQNASPQGYRQRLFGQQKNRHPQAARLRSNQQNSGRALIQDNLDRPESSSEQTFLATWFQGYQGPATQGSHQRPGQRNRGGNRYGLNRQQKTFSQPQNPTAQSSAQPPNTRSDDSNQQKPPQNATARHTPRLTALQMIHDFTKEWNPDLHHNHQPFTKLPGDLALCIMDHLKDPVDKISLALTTKSMWEWSQGVLKLDDFNLQQVLPMRVSEKRGTIMPWPYFRSYRWRLVERLEDEHWKACSGCLRLHSKTEFFPDELKEPANERYCRAPGLIQICPHLLLTYKKCATLQKVLAEQSGGNKHNYQDTDLDKYLYHECSMKAGGSSKLIIGTQPFITDNKQQLVFRQKYVLQVNSENLKENLEWIDSRFPLPNLCPHRSIVTHCLDMLNENSLWKGDMITENNAGPETANVTCKGCGTYFSGFRRYTHSSSQKFRIEFFSSKLLGKDFGLRECKLGHGVSHELQSWIDTTHLANLVDVTDTVHYGCKCPKKCRKLAYEPISCPSPRASLPDSTWKGDVSAWQF